MHIGVELNHATIGPSTLRALAKKRGIEEMEIDIDEE